MTAQFHTNINVPTLYYLAHISVLHISRKIMMSENESAIITKSIHYKIDTSSLVGKPTMWFPNRSDSNRAVQAQKMAGDWKFWVWKVEEL